MIFSLEVLSSSTKSIGHEEREIIVRKNFNFSNIADILYINDKSLANLALVF